VHYANAWFGKFGKEPPPADDKFLGKIRLEAATGEDFTDQVSIPKPDGMMERAYQFVKWLAKETPQGNWGYFLAEDGTGLRWDRVIIAGSSRRRTASSPSATSWMAAGAAAITAGPGSCWDCSSSGRS
jgi:hypothetical protein